MIEVVSLRNDEWIVQGSVEYDSYFDVPSKEYRVKKVGKSEFIMREICAAPCNRVTDKWVTFKMK